MEQDRTADAPAGTPADHLVKAAAWAGERQAAVQADVSRAWQAFRRKANENPEALLVAQQRLQRFVVRILLFKLLAGLATLAFSLTYTNPYIPPGHEGYVYERPRVLGAGGFKGTVEGPGNFGVSVWRNEAVSIDLSPQTYTEEFTVLTRDDLNLIFRFHAVISIGKGRVREVVEDLGGLDWYNRFIREPFRSYIRDAVQKHRSTDIKAMMESVAADIRANLAAHVEKTPFTLVSLVVGDINYPEVVARAVEEKLSAQQVLEAKETQMQIAIKDAEIELVQARGKAEAQQIIAATLTPAYLQHEAIESQAKFAQSPNHTTIYIPVGNNGIPLVRPVE